jgi:uncharacterized membrane protein
MAAETLLVEKKRIESIDILRGVIMLIMALDHTRDFLHNAAGLGDPTNMVTTTPIFFFTRWITHFCAPNFVFLGGISAYLAGTRRTKSELGSFLVKRGLWLVIVELVVMSFAFTLDPFYNFLVMQVLWVTGISMIVLGLLALARAPLAVFGALGALIFFGHDILDYVTFPKSGVAFVLDSLFLNAKGTLLEIDPTHHIFDLYAIIPWVGVMLLGYCFGSLYATGADPVKRRKILRYTGLSALALFLILRFFNIYGDPAPWVTQRNGVITFLSFLNVSKYPPSLLYSLLTIGTGLVALSLLENVHNKLTSIFIVYGNVPFFYYILHFYLLRIFNVIIFFAEGFKSSQIIGNRGLFAPPGFGLSLGGVYLAWLSVIIILYLPCRWFSKYKKTHRQWWLSYL